jgi:hypothetical protein
MSTYKAREREKDCGCKQEECPEDVSRQTQKTINTERLKYCNELYVAAGDVVKWEKTYEGEYNLYNRKKCMFVLTEGNYQRYRNTEICLGTELIQTTELIKENVKSYVDWGGKLNSSLKDIFKKVKEAKGKMGELLTAACSIENDKNNSCHDSEWTALLGRPKANCGKEPTGDLPKDYPDKCKDIDQTICDLICMPKSLNKDINSIFKSSSEIIGIQVFSNIGTLDPIQEDLSKKAKAFDTHLQDVVKSRETDMKDLQKALVKSVQETTKAAGSLYTSRSTFEALGDTTKYFCCPMCGCVTENTKCEDGRLEECECKVCKICKDVQQTFCDDGCGTPQSQAD